jgi:hypothetical protein
LLEVFDPPDQVNGAEGSRFFIHGPRLGKASIVKVMTDRAEGAVLPGGSVKVGSWVMDPQP